MSYRGVGGCVYTMFSICQTMKNRIRGRVTRSNRMDMEVFPSPCRFSWPFMMGQQTESDSFYREIFVGSLRKTFGHLSDTSKKAQTTSAVSPAHYTCNKVFPPIFPLGLFAPP